MEGGREKRNCLPANPTILKNAPNCFHASMHLQFDSLSSKQPITNYRMLKTYFLSNQNMFHATFAGKMQTTQLFLLCRLPKGQKLRVIATEFAVAFLRSNLEIAQFHRKTCLNRRKERVRTEQSSQIFADWQEQKLQKIRSFIPIVCAILAPEKSGIQDHCLSSLTLRQKMNLYVHYTLLRGA